MKLLRTPFLLIIAASVTLAQTSPRERTFPQSTAAVQAVLKSLPGGISGPLPVLDGFVAANVNNLDQYQRPYYKCTISVTPAASGASRVRVTARITAWHEGGAKPGYDSLPSNGRLESDLLDRLQQALSATAKQASPNPERSTKKGEKARVAADAPTINAPTPQLPKHFEASNSSSPSSQGDPALQRESDSLSEILRNQSHPTNLVAVKADRTPMLQNPALDAQVLFLANAEDEFEVIESNPGWIHVRISGISRGWLRRSSVEILDGSEVPEAQTAGQLPTAPSKTPETKPSEPPTTKFSVSSEETGNFPGDWAPLKGKSVKIVSVQVASGAGPTSPEDKLKFAEETFKKQSSSANASGLVIIFDTEDGGMIAATTPVIERYQKNGISEQAFWKQCFIDPPEILAGEN